MSPRRRVLLSAISSVLLLTAFSAPVYAQFYDAARGALGFSLDAIERSPRMLGMGGMTFVGDDPHMAITLWDFAGSPLGVLDADSTDTAEFYPATSSFSRVHDLAAGDATLERQERAARESRIGYEVWRRTPGQSVFGVTGDFGSMRMDQILSETIEQSSTFTQPTAMPVMMGHIPYVKSSHWLYSMRLFYSGEMRKNEFREVWENSQGQYIDRTGAPVDPPDLFTPNDYRVRTLGGGVGVAYDRGRAFKAAVNSDYVQSNITGKNESARHVARNDEARPYYTTQVTMVGRLAGNLEWGVDGRDWRSRSEETWSFSISAGTSAPPLVGGGKMQDRDERGQALRTRLRWTQGPFQVGGGVTTGYRKVSIMPPSAGDLTSFNHFRTVIYYRPNTDSLVLPDSVTFAQSEERTWEAGGGLLVRLPGGRGSWGVEYHRSQGLLEQTASGQGPLRKGWDVRTGLEYRCNPVLSGRIGYVHRWEDEDDYTRQNEYLANAVTLGLGIRPVGATWAFEAGYAIEWRQADFGAPADPRSSRQQLASVVRWTF